MMRCSVAVGVGWQLRSVVGQQAPKFLRCSLCRGLPCAAGKDFLFWTREALSVALRAIFGAGLPFPAHAASCWLFAQFLRIRPKTEFRAMRGFFGGSGCINPVMGCLPSVLGSGRLLRRFTGFASSWLGRAVLSWP